MAIERYIPYTTEGLNFYDMAVDVDRQLIFYPDRDNDLLYMINLKENTTSKIAVGTYPSRLDLNSATAKLYLSYGCGCPAGQTVTVVDYSQGLDERPIRTIQNASGPGASVEVNQVTNKVYVIKPSGDITVIDGATDSILDSINGISAGAIDFNNNAKLIYALSANNTIYKINGTTNEVISRTEITGFPVEDFKKIDYLMVLAVNPNTNMVYLVDFAAIVCDSCDLPVPFQYVVAFNGTTDEVMNYRLADITGFARDVAVNTIDNRVYASNGHSVVVLDGLTNNIAYTSYWEPQEYIQELRIDPVANKIYMRGQTGIFIANDRTDSGYGTNGTNPGDEASSALKYKCLRQDCHYDLAVDNRTISVRYKMPGEVKSMHLDLERKSLVVSIDSNITATFSIELPRSVIQSMSDDGDMNFSAFADGKATYVEDLGQNATHRGIFVTYENGTKQIEIVGTWVIPEFSSQALLFLVAVSFVPILIYRIPHCTRLLRAYPISQVLTRLNRAQKVE